MSEQFYIGAFLYEQHILWDIQCIITENFKMISAWKCIISTFLINARLFHTCFSTHSIQLGFPQHSLSSVSISTIFSLKRKLFHPHSLVLALTLFSMGHASYPPPCGEDFWYKEIDSLLKSAAHDTLLDHQFGDQYERIFLYWDIYLWTTHFVRKIPHIYPKSSSNRCADSLIYKVFNLNFSN